MTYDPEGLKSIKEVSESNKKHAFCYTHKYNQMHHHQVNHSHHKHTLTVVYARSTSMFSNNLK